MQYIGVTYLVFVLGNNCSVNTDGYKNWSYSALTVTLSAGSYLFCYAGNDFKIYLYSGNNTNPPVACPANNSSYLDNAYEVLYSYIQYTGNYTIVVATRMYSYNEKDIYIGYGPSITAEWPYPPPITSTTPTGESTTTSTTILPSRIQDQV